METLREQVRLSIAGSEALLELLDRRLADGKPLILAIDGRSAAGKTTLAENLAKLFGGQVFHMDDFFLRPEQRTPERLREPGGNVDRERFREEVLLPLSRREPVRVRRFCCHTGTMEPPVEIPWTPFSIVEGAYSLHPELAEFYQCTLFLTVPPAVQHARILRRNGAEQAQTFFRRWIPMEEHYIQALRPDRRADFLLTGTAENDRQEHE